MQGFRNYNIDMMQREQLVDMMPSQYGKSISPPLSPNSGKFHLSNSRTCRKIDIKSTNDPKSDKQLSH